MMDSSAANDDDENNKETDDQKDLINLPQPVKISANKIHQCDVCSKQFSRKDSLTRHKLVHLKTKPYSCEVCLMTFARYDQMERHLRTHRNDDTYDSDLRSTKVHQCNICLKEFSRKDIMKKHMFTHSGIKPFTCEICFKAFGRRDHMEKHFRTHSKDKSLSDSLFELMSYQQQTGDDLPIIKTEAEEPYFCEDGEENLMETNYQTASAKDIYKKHMFIHSGLKPFSCEICAKAFGRKDYLKKHMLTHYKDKPISKNESEPVFNGVNVSEDIQPQWCLKEESEFSETDTSRDIKIEIGEESLITSHIHTPNTNDMLQVHSKIKNKSKNI